jgi:hypothetical protein
LLTGTEVGIEFYPWTNAGVAVMSLNGSSIASFDTEGPAESCGMLAWTSNTLSPSTYVLTVTAVGTLYIYYL